MQIVMATSEDSAEILALYRTMLYGAADWNEFYPDEKTIADDLSRNSLFVMKNENNDIIAAISIDKDDEVDALPCWDKSLLPGGEFSRICVRKDMQNQGIARKMIGFVLEKLKNEGKKSVHILVKTGHTVALGLYTKIGFKQVGECTMFDKDFVCMEIAL